VRPVEQVAVAVERHPQHAADDRDRVGLRVVVEQLRLTGFGERLEQLAGALLGGLPQSLDAARRERSRNELPDPGVIGRLEPEETPALDVPEGLPAGIEWGHPDLGGLQHMPEVAPELLVSEAAAHVLVPGDEPALTAGVVEDPGALAEGVQHRIGIREESRVRGIEPDRFTQRHGLTIGCGRPSYR
jgi:hypothetical protein